MVITAEVIGDGFENWLIPVDNDECQDAIFIDDLRVESGRVAFEAVRRSLFDFETTRGRFAGRLESTPANPRWKLVLILEGVSDLVSERPVGTGIGTGILKID